MFILSKRSIIIKSDDGSARYKIAKDYIGPVPDWVTKTAYYKELVTDGKIVPTSGKDKDLDKAAEKPVTDNAKKSKSDI